jgi:hypothetical protein
MRGPLSVKIQGIRTVNQSARQDEFQAKPTREQQARAHGHATFDRPEGAKAGEFMLRRDPHPDYAEGAKLAPKPAPKAGIPRKLADFLDF